VGVYSSGSRRRLPVLLVRVGEYTSIVEALSAAKLRHELNELDLAADTLMGFNFSEKVRVLSRQVRFFLTTFLTKKRFRRDFGHGVTR
jgi:hypothetical protein